MNLTRLSLPVKVLFTGYIVAVGVGLMMAGLQILLTHGMADGKFGLSIDDIVYSYYGNRTGSTLEAKLNGSMKDKAPPEERTKIIEWARTGADRGEFDTVIRPIIMQRCAMCHGKTPGLTDITKYEKIAELAETDTGLSMTALTRVSHIHLFGISFIFMLVGLIFSFAYGFRTWVKAVIIFTPFGFLVIDIMSWWLTKLWPQFAWLTLIGGVAYTLASTVMILTSLWQMWITPWTKGPVDYNAWGG